MDEMCPSYERFSGIQIGCDRIFIEHFTKLATHFDIGYEEWHIRNQIIVFAFGDLVRVKRITLGHGGQKEPVMRSPDVGIEPGFQIHE